MENRMDEFLKKALIHKICREYRDKILYFDGLAEEILQCEHPEDILNKLQLIDFAIRRVEYNLKFCNYRRIFHLLGMIRLMVER